ncbi:MAG: CoA transferase [Dehalococcoidia bacterium]
MAGPLEGIRVIEMSTWGALPGGGAILSDWGADVIKVEEPQGGGDPARAFAMTSNPEGTATIAPVWEQDNRNKKSATIDVSKPEGHQALLRLLQNADVFLTSSRPQTLKKFQLSYEHLEKLNPRLVMCHLSGFGPKGADSERPGYDALCFWGRAGFALALAPGDEPIGQRPALGDHVTSIAIAGGVAAALVAREKTGRGQFVQASLFHSGLWVSSIDQVTASMSQQNIVKFTRGIAGNPLVGTFQTADGWIQMVNLQPDRFWAPFCRAAGREDLIDDPLYDTLEKRAERAGELMGIFQEEFIKRPTAEWIPRFDAHGVRWGKIQTILEASKDEQAWTNGYFQTVEHPEAGRLNLVTSPLQFSDTPTAIKATAPMLGQHTEEVLLEAGYSWDEIGTLKDKGVIL